MNLRRINELLPAVVAVLIGSVDRAKNLSLYGQTSSGCNDIISGDSGSCF